MSPNRINIREDIVHVISRRAYVTLSQHGYRVLTTKKMVILDLDARNNITPDAIVNDFIRIWEGNGIEARIYRTSNGVRVFLMHYNIGRNFSHALKEIMRIVPHCDPLYMDMCANQLCFRARLDTKPHRTNGISIACNESNGYAVTRFITALNISQGPFRFDDDDIIQYHDLITNAHNADAELQ